MFEKPIFFYDNLLKKHTVTVTTENASYPKGNLFDDDINSLFKPTGFGDLSISIDAGVGNTISADTLCIGNHNLFTAGAGAVLQASDDNFASLLDVADVRPESNALVHGLQRLIVGGDFEVWPGGAAAAPAGFQVHGFAGGSVAREAVIVNKKYSMKLTRAAADGGYKHVLLDNALAQIKGKTVAFGCYVYCSTANTARLTVNGTQLGVVNSAFHTGSGAWEWLTVAVTVSSSETLLAVICDMMTNATFAYFDVMRAKAAAAVTSVDQSDVVTTPLAKRYWRVLLSGMAAIPQIGELAFGARYDLQSYLSGGFDRERRIEGNINIADGGQKETIIRHRRNAFPVNIESVRMNSQEETDLLAWRDAVEDGTPFWFLVDTVGGTYQAYFVSLSELGHKAPYDRRGCRNFNFVFEEEL